MTSGAGSFGRRVVAFVAGLALCACAVAVLRWKIVEAASASSTSDAVWMVSTSLVLGLLLAAAGLGLLGVGLSAGGASAPPEDELVPYERPGDAGRARRRRTRTVLHRTAGVTCGLSLIVLGPYLVVMGITGGQFATGDEPLSFGQMGLGVISALLGLVTIAVSVSTTGRVRSKLRRTVAVPAATAPHAEHDFPD